MIKSAVISECGRYRYALHRKWDESLPTLAWCMLNPSTADASIDDPTIRRCITFAKREGCGSIAVINLFAWRATDPDQLPIVAAAKAGPLNESVVEVNVRGRRVVVAWGAHDAAEPSAVHPMLALLQQHADEVLCLGTTKSGAPRHPLYVRSDAPLTPYAWKKP